MSYRQYDALYEMPLTRRIGSNAVEDAVVKERNALFRGFFEAKSSLKPHYLVRMFWLLAIWILASTPLWAQAPGAWQPAADLHQPRAGHTATLLANDKVPIAGGKDASGRALATAELYDPASGQYTPVTAQLPVPVWGHTATLLNDGKVLLAGGNDGSGQPVSHAQLFDPSTGKFTALTLMGTARSRHTATLLSDGRVLIAGGTDGVSARAELEIYDPATRKFSPAPNPLLTPRQNHTATLLPDGKVLIIGGSGISGALDSAELYNPDNGQIALVGSLNVARTLASAALLLDGTVLVAGGQDTEQRDLDSAEIYDPVTASFTPLPVYMVTARSGHVGLTLPHNGKVLVAGGTNAGQPVSTVEVYDPVLGEFWAVESPSTARQLFGANFFTVSYPGVLLASGGLDSSQQLLASSELFFYPTLRSDKQDYPPGDTVTLTGEGWSPNEVVTITVHESSGDQDTTLTATANAAGAFTNSQLQTNPDRSDVGVRFLATAIGQQSNWTAQTTFTDGIPTRIRENSMSPSSGACGSTITVAATLEQRIAPPSTWGPLAGMTVTFTLGSSTRSGTTGSNGVATASLTVPAGATSLTAAYAGDTNYNKTSTDIAFTVSGSCDTTPPTLSLPGNMTQEATGPSGAVVTFTATATDQNPSNPTVTCTPASGSTFPLGVTTVKCSATDAAGNMATGSFKVTVQDTTPPSLSLPANITAEATGPMGATVSYPAPTATDVVDGPVAVACTPASGSAFALGTTAVTCSATDKAGNTASRTFTVTVQDTTPPSLSLPANVTAEATGSAGAVVSYTATAVDAVDGARPVTCAPASGSTFTIGTTTVSCSASDTHGNTASGSFAVTVQDTTKPSLTLPSAITVEATGFAGAAVTYSVGATDVVDGAVAVTCSSASGSPFALGTTTVTCTATDAHGNSASGSFAVTVVDTTPPSLTVPADMTVEATGPAGAAVSYGASALDIVDGAVTPTCAPASGSTFPIAATTVTCTATDAHGNSASKSFRVLVQDTTPPVLTLPAPITTEATGPTGAVVTYTASATDLVDGPVAVICSPASGTTVALGTAMVSCSAADAHGNKATNSFTVTVQDTTPPMVVPPANVVAEATGPSGAVVTYSGASATDVVDGSLTPTCSPSSGATFALGTTTVSCSATDAHGNTGSATFTVTVRDTTPPALTLPSSMTVEATGPSGAAVSYAASATDLVDGAVAVNCAPASGSPFALGTTTVSCSASDAHGNKATGNFTVMVVDTTPPVLTLPANISKEATGPSGAAVSYTAGATDVVDGPVAVACTPASGSAFALGTTTVTCSALDRAGNTAKGSFAVTVVDTTPPVLTLPTPITAEATGPGGAVVTYTASANDLVDGAVTPSCAPASGSAFALGTTTVSCSASDTRGNTASGSFAVTVQDTTKPSLSLPPNITTNPTGLSNGLSVATVTYEASATDLVDGAVPVTCTPPSGSTFAIGTTTVSCSAADAHGNTASGSFTVMVVYNWDGFFRPVENDGVVNQVKAGSAIPVKFRLNGYWGLNIFFNGYPRWMATSCTNWETTIAVDETVTAGSSSLSYDATADQYVYVWKTDKAWAGSCRLLNVTLSDGTQHWAKFRFTK
jgi:hypothetical protein